MSQYFFFNSGLVVAWDIFIPGCVGETTKVILSLFKEKNCRNMSHWQIQALSRFINLLLFAVAPGSSRPLAPPPIQALFSSR